MSDMENDQIGVDVAGFANFALVIGVDPQRLAEHLILTGLIVLGRLHGAEAEAVCASIIRGYTAQEKCSAHRRSMT